MVPSFLRSNIKPLAAIAAAIVILPSLEGTIQKSYWDKWGKVWTACTGHTGPDVAANRIYSLDQCGSWLLGDATKANNIIDKYVKVPISDDVRTSLILFIFNVGEGNFAKSTLLKKINKGDLKGACNEFPRWNMAGGVVLPGLVKRRALERNLCLSGLK